MFFKKLFFFNSSHSTVLINVVIPDNNGMCEPNQFQCANRRCVLKTWLCDSEDDCLDGSDEQNCGVPDNRQICTPVEFKCMNSDQCVPRSFHCDGQTDCGDGTDEIGCGKQNK